MAASGVQSVTFEADPASARVQGGVVLLQLGAGASRSGRVMVRLALPFDPDSGRVIAVPLPAFRSAALEGRPDGLEVLGASEDGTIDPSQRALLVRGDASDAPRVRAARYRLLLRPGAAEVELRVEVMARGGRGPVALAPAAVALVDVQLDGRVVATEEGDDEHHSVMVDGRGPRLVLARFVIPTEGDAEDLRVSLGRVASAITEVEVRVAGKRAIRFEPEVPLRSEFAGGQTMVRGYLPPGEALEIGFTADGDAVERTVRFSAESYHVLTMDEGLLRGRVTMELQIVQGKATALQIALPDEAVVSSVEGDSVSTWDVLAPSGDLPRRLRVGLAEGDGKTCSLSVAFERPVASAAGTTFDLPVLRPLGAFRESGAVVLIDGEKVGFKAIEGAPGWLRAGLEALPAAERQKLDGRGD